MRSRTLGILGSVAILSAAAPAAAQSDIETRVNPVTGNTEQVYNPWNNDQITRDRNQRSSDHNMSVINNRVARDQQASVDRRRANNDLYNSNVALITERNRVGLAKIRSGHATTGFTPAPGFSVGSFFAKSYPQAGAQIVPLAQSASAQFHASLRAHGLGDHDLADGAALAFITAFEVYSGQKTSPAHLANVRAQNRKSLLTNSMLQAAPDDERQRDFEKYGTLAFGARMAVAQGDTVGGRELAASVVTGLGRVRADAVVLTPNGFGHKGDAIIAAGRATTLFTPGNVEAPQAYVRSFTDKGTAAFTAQRATQGIAAFYSELAQRGGRANDLVDVVTYLMVGNAAALGGQEPNPAQIQSVKAMARAAILRSRDIQAAGDGEKQLAVELMMIPTIAALQKRDNPQARDNLINIFAALGEDWRNYQLTETGLVRLAQAQK